MALLPSLAAGWLPPVLAGFRASYPGIELEVADVLSEACLDRVRGGSADFALAATRADTAELRTEVFCTDRFHLVCRRDHPLARKPSPRLKDLASEAFVQMSRGSSVRQYIDAAVHPLRMNAVLEVEQLATVTGSASAWCPRSPFSTSAATRSSPGRSPAPGSSARSSSCGGATGRCRRRRRRCTNG
jgi:DNA-binding transcriptional LysR family regulator